MKQQPIANQQPAGIRLGNILGIPLVLDWSLFIAAALIVTTLAFGPFRSLHADWSGGTIWIVSVLAAVGLFAAIYLHELGHALVARRYGIKVERITLFILGGMAQLAEEPKSWRAELWIALAGPAVSVVLGGLLLTAALLNLPSEPSWTSPETFFASLSPTASLLLWLGNVNIMLAVFNCLPAFPLDGGRVLRALLWAATQRMSTATRWAAASGQLFGYGFIVGGVAMVVGISLPFFGAGLQGLWLILVGWFLTRAAAGSVTAVRYTDAFTGVPLASVIQHHFQVAASDMTIKQLVDEQLLPHAQRVSLVTGSYGSLLGLVTESDIKKVPADKWVTTTVASIMTPYAQLATVHPNDTSVTAMQRLLQHGVRQLPVVDDAHKCVGLFTKEQAERWLSIAPSGRSRPTSFERRVS